MAKSIDMATYNELVASGKPFVIDFWAEWCGPCRMLSPIIEELSQEYEGRVTIGKCDVDGNSDLAMKFSVRNIPLVVFCKGGELVDKLVGASNKEALKAKIDALL